MKTYILFIIFLSNSCMMQAQMNIDSILIYEHFPERGFTTAGLSSEFKSLKEKQLQTISLSSEDVSAIEQIINKSKVKKHTQTKTGVGPVFGTIKSSSNLIDVVIFDNLIIDMTNHVNYWTKGEGDGHKIQEILAKTKTRNAED